MFEIRKSKRQAIAYITVFGSLFMSNLSACATTNNGPVRHTFSVEIANNITTVRHLRYRYGDLGWREMAIAAPPGPLSSQTQEMIVPEEFEISWESETGQKYDFHIPIQSRIKVSLLNKSVRIVIADHGIECYVGTHSGIGKEQRERFY